MTDRESDYNSSDDEDYVPEEGVEDVDYPSGDEVLFVHPSVSLILYIALLTFLMG